MNFTTPVAIPKSEHFISYDQKLLLLGSCFVENVGERLLRNKFRADVNPFGILYNPFSVASSLERLIAVRPFTVTDLFENNGIWHSFSHHSRFSDTDPTLCMEKINKRYFRGAGMLEDAGWMLITWGTAFVYTHRETGRIVSNCHKLPEKIFDRRMLSAEEIAEYWESVLNRLLAFNPGVRIILTISPIRHLKDGAHGNQLSKGALLAAADRLTRTFSSVRYFPSYEIMMDELRDYRFYAPDMVHPSDVAVEYIWERFTETFFSAETLHLMNEWGRLSKSLQHKPLNPASSAYKDFIMQNLLKLKKMREKYPFFEIESEITFLEKQLHDRL